MRRTSIMLAVGLASISSTRSDIRTNSDHDWHKPANDDWFEPVNRPVSPKSRTTRRHSALPCSSSHGGHLGGVPAPVLTVSARPLMRLPRSFNSVGDVRFGPRLRDIRPQKSKGKCLLDTLGEMATCEVDS